MNGLFQPLRGRLSGPVPFLLLAVVLCAALFQPYLGGKALYLFTDIGSDGVNAFYPRMVQLADHLRAWGLPDWSWRHGMGQKIFPWGLGDPFSLALLALGRERLGPGIGWVEAAKVLAGGGLFWLYLRRLRLSHLARTVGGLCFAFSGFMIVGGGWYQFSTEAVYVALALYAFERGFTGGRWGLLPLAFAAIGMAQPFGLYTTGLFLGTYAAARQVAAHGFTLRGVLARWGRLGALALLGTAMSAGLLVSQVRTMLLSPRGSGDATHAAELAAHGALHPGSPLEYATTLARLFGNDLYGTGSRFTGWTNYLEAPLLYVGVVALLLCPLAFPLLARRERWAWGGLLAFWLLPLAWPGLRHAAWLFTGDYYRVFALFAGLCLLVPALLALDRIDRGARPHLPLLGATLAALVAALLLLPAPGATVPPFPRALLAGFLVAYAALVAWAALWRGGRPVLRRALPVLVCLELGLSAFPTLRMRPVVTAADLARGALYGGDSARAADLLAERDPGFYRVSKPFSASPGSQRGFNDSLAQGFNGTASYDSFNQRGYIRFLVALQVIPPGSELYTRWAPGLMDRPLLETLAAVKYRMVPDGAPDPPFVAAAYVPWTRVGRVRVLENTRFLPLGFAYDQYLDPATFARLAPGLKDLVLLHAVVLDAPEAAVRGLVPLSPATPLDLDVALAARRAEGLQVTAHAPNRIEGRIAVPGPRLLFLSIPYDAGWSARVDGLPERITQVDAGLSGLFLEAGRHTVELEYHVPWLAGSAAVSAVGWGAWGWLFLRRRGPNAERGRADPA